MNRFRARQILLEHIAVCVLLASSNTSFSAANVEKEHLQLSLLYAPLTSGGKSLFLDKIPDTTIVKFCVWLHTVNFVDFADPAAFIYADVERQWGRVKGGGVLEFSVSRLPGTKPAAKAVDGNAVTATFTIDRVPAKHIAHLRTKFIRKIGPNTFAISVVQESSLRSRGAVAAAKKEAKRQKT